MQGWVVVIIAVAYVTLLFVIASLGDRWSAKRGPARTRPYIYALSLAIYCTSWTFFGSVGLATERGLEFLAIYIGPVLVFLFGFPLLKRIIKLAKAEKITSIADFLGLGVLFSGCPEPSIHGPFYASEGLSIDCNRYENISHNCDERGLGPISKSGNDRMVHFGGVNLANCPIQMI